MKNLLFVIIIFIFLISCGENTVKNEHDLNGNKLITNAEVIVPVFNKDSAYHFIEAQLAFGPRVPNTAAHKACAEYLENKLQSYTDTVIVQKTRVRAFDGTALQISNIIASFKPAERNRIFLCAHWDSRHIAEKDPNPDMQNKPIDGANDGASGVGILIEIARILNKNQAPIGLDIILFDAEDYGQPHNSQLPTMEDTWALGSQYWAANPHVPGYYAKYGILLDMVGAENATFLKEGYSMQYAPNIVNKVWQTANRLGYGNYFLMQESSHITDDHFYINTIANIPTIDIIHYDRNTGTGFFPYWHTQGDNLEKIDKNTLEAVGQTLLQVIFEEK